MTVRAEAAASPARVRQTFRRASLPRSLFYGALLGLVLALGFEVLRVTLGANLHAVVPGQCYRCAQLSGSRLTAIVNRLGIRTVVNLRGSNDDEEWYQEECATTHDLGIDRVDIKMSGYEAPVDAELCRLLETLNGARYPILVHCCSGSDRSGFASALFLLLKTDTTVAEARGQLGIRFGHNPFGSASCQEEILDGYEGWLAEAGRVHSSSSLRTWVRDVYHTERGKMVPRRNGPVAGVLP